MHQDARDCKCLLYKHPIQEVTNLSAGQEYYLLQSNMEAMKLACVLIRWLKV